MGRGRRQRTQSYSDPVPLQEFRSVPESQKPAEQIQGTELSQASGCLLLPVLAQDCVHVLVPALVTPDPGKSCQALTLPTESRHRGCSWSRGDINPKWQGIPGSCRFRRAESHFQVPERRKGTLEPTTCGQRNKFICTKSGPNSTQATCNK